MNQWPHKVLYTTRAEINDAVKDQYWQALRRGMKGMSTPYKLLTLEMYRHYRSVHVSPTSINRILDDKARIQIDNYVNALKRGGQLDSDLKVVK